MNRIEMQWDGVGVFKSVRLIGDAKLGTLEKPIITLEGEGFAPLSLMLSDIGALQQLFAIVAETHAAALRAPRRAPPPSVEAIAQAIAPSPGVTEITRALINNTLDLAQNGLATPAQAAVQVMRTPEPVAPPSHIWVSYRAQSVRGALTQIDADDAPSIADIGARTVVLDVQAINGRSTCVGAFLAAMENAGWKWSTDQRPTQFWPERPFLSLCNGIICFHNECPTDHNPIQVMP